MQRVGIAVDGVADIEGRFLLIPEAERQKRAGASVRVRNIIYAQRLAGVGRHVPPEIQNLCAIIRVGLTGGREGVIDVVCQIAR